MPTKPITVHFRAELILLGTGTSVGVPSIGCGCAVCQSSDPRNKRTRCSAILGLPDGNLLIDTSPDLRFQLLRERIGIVHAVVFTHEHADHILGLDDLRIFQFYLRAPVPVYCEPLVEQRIRQAFSYAFQGLEPTHEGAVPQLTFHRVGLTAFEVLGARLIPIRLQHGPRFEVLGFRVGKVAYCTDANEIPERSWPLLDELDVLVLDTLRDRPHATHFSLDQALGVIERLQPKRALLTHISHELDHATINARLPPHVQLAYDGQRVPLT